MDEKILEKYVINAMKFVKIMNSFKKIVKKWIKTVKNLYKKFEKKRWKPLIMMKNAVEIMTFGRKSKMSMEKDRETSKNIRRN